MRKSKFTESQIVATLKHVEGGRQANTKKQVRYAMAGRWETHRGDEWWYSDYWCKLDARFNTAYPGTLSIDRADFKGQLIEGRVHNLLWSTQQQFKDNLIEVCGLSELVPVLHALQSAGLLKAKQRDSTYAKCIQITDIAAPPHSPAKVSIPTSKKLWWRFW